MDEAKDEQAPPWHPNFAAEAESALHPDQEIAPSYGVSGATRPSRVLFWSDLKRMPRREALVKGLFDQGSFAEIFGAWGSGKSFLAIDLGVHVALGWPWRGRRVHQGGVLYVGVEAGRGITDRLDAWQRHYQEDFTDIPFGSVIAETNLLDGNGVDQIVADAAAVPDIALVVIDTAARTMQGSDEGAADFGKFVAACDRIREATGACVLVVHHAGKDASRGSRGSTVLPAAADTAVEVVNKKGTVTATIAKQRDGKTGDDIHSKLYEVELDPDEDGDPVNSCVVLPADEPPKATETDLTPNQTSMFAILKDAMPGGLSVEQWNEQARADGLGVKRRADLSDFRRALKRKKLVYQYNETWYAAQ